MRKKKTREKNLWNSKWTTHTVFFWTGTKISNNSNRKKNKEATALRRKDEKRKKNIPTTFYRSEKWTSKWKMHWKMQSLLKLINYLCKTHLLWLSTLYIIFVKRVLFCFVLFFSCFFSSVFYFRMASTIYYVFLCIFWSLCLLRSHFYQVYMAQIEIKITIVLRF